MGRECAKPSPQQARIFRAVGFHWVMMQRSHELRMVESWNCKGIISRHMAFSELSEIQCVHNSSEIHDENIASMIPRTWPRCHCMMSVMSLQHLGWNANTPTWFGNTFGDVGHHAPGWQFIVLAKWYQRMCGWRSHWPYMFFEFGASFLNCLFDSFGIFELY